MSNRIPIVDKTHLLEKSKTFCMFPWLHLYSSPRGEVYPCCTTNPVEPLGSVKTNTLKEIFNNDKTKQLRLNMLNDVPSEVCESCYKMEETSPHSYRNFSKNVLGHNFDDTVTKTHADGSLDNFEMKYIDIRFSNICNFKCRTCGSECSSQVAAEERQLGKHDYIVLHADDKAGNLLDEVMEHLDYVQTIYFAGGEPLITDEHYVLVEELIRKGRTDVTLKYNTNASNINYKGKDLLGLWSKFNHIDVACSIDHYGERAELIRHGTNWGTVESNLTTFRNLPNVTFSISTVLSVFNYLTIHDFYNHLIGQGLIFAKDTNHYLSITSNPSYYAATTLPRLMKDTMQPNIEVFFDLWPDFKLICDQIRYAINFANSADTWDDNKYDFIRYSWMKDRLRDEDLIKVFPELEPMVMLI